MPIVPIIMSILLLTTSCASTTNGPRTQDETKAQCSVRVQAEKSLRDSKAALKPSSSAEWDKLVDNYWKTFEKSHKEIGCKICYPRN